MILFFTTNGLWRIFWVFHVIICKFGQIICNSPSHLSEKSNLARVRLSKFPLLSLSIIKRNNFSCLILQNRTWTLTSRTPATRSTPGWPCWRSAASPAAAAAAAAAAGPTGASWWWRTWTTGARPTSSSPGKEKGKEGGVSSTSFAQNIFGFASQAVFFCFFFRGGWVGHVPVVLCTNHVYISKYQTILALVFGSQVFFKLF